MDPSFSEAANGISAAAAKEIAQVKYVALTGHTRMVNSILNKFSYLDPMYVEGPAFNTPPPVGIVFIAADNSHGQTSQDYIRSVTSFLENIQVDYYLNGLVHFGDDDAKAIIAAAKKIDGEVHDRYLSPEVGLPSQRLFQARTADEGWSKIETSLLSLAGHQTFDPLDAHEIHTAYGSAFPAAPAPRKLVTGTAVEIAKRAAAGVRGVFSSAPPFATPTR